MSERAGTVRIEPHSDGASGYSVWVLAQPTRDAAPSLAWVCVWSTYEGNRGQWLAEAALDPQSGWGVGPTEIVGAVPGTPAAN